MDRVTVIELTGSRLDDWWQHLMTRPGARLAWRWGGPAVVLVVAALLRLVGLGHPHELVFDETYYVKDAYTLSHLGYESRWPADADLAFINGHTDIYLDTSSFAVHPPIGKWIIAAGLAVFGADDSVGWRIAVAISGILLVLITMLIAQRLFHSTLLAVIAGGLMAIDGNAIVLSRVAVLDSMLALFALLGVGAVLLDRPHTERRLAAWVADDPSRRASSSPAFWNRPWLLAAGVAFGLASGVKWSGLYFLAVFAVYALGTEVLMRRRAGIRSWFGGTILRQGPITFLLMVPTALAVYLASWTGWFVTDGGSYRHWIESGDGTPWGGALAWVPVDFQNWWHLQASVYAYHVGEHQQHPYQANPLTWLFLVRPTSMYFHAEGNSAEAIIDLANPLIWWAGTAAIFYLVFRLVRGLVRGHSVRLEAFILTGILAGYVPWLLYLGRTVFQFYTIAFEPFLVLALVAVIGMLLGSPQDLERRRVAGQQAVGTFLVLCVVLSVFFLPIWTGLEIPRWYMTIHFWFRSWW